MSCNLSKYQTYNVGRVVHDNNTGAYTAQLVNPPTSCPDQVFSSKKAALKVVEGINPQLSYDVLANKATIMVPREEYVEQIGSSGHSGLALLLALAGAAVIGYLVYRNRQSETPAMASTDTVGPGPSPYASGGFSRSGVSSSPGPSSSNTRRLGLHRSAEVPLSQQPNSASNVTIVNNGSNNDGLLTGVMLGSMLNSHPERVIERETVVECQSSRSSRDDSDDNSSSSYSSDSDSDSSSSFSSDNDSSSSFGSDSGSDSSFSSDSGGSSFGSDD